MEREWWKKESLVKFNSPTTIMVCGPTGSGKTYLTKQILEHADGMFSEKPSKIIICYNSWQPIFDELRTKLEKITFHQGLPNDETFTEWTEIDGHKILVIDDCMAEGSNSSELQKMFCVNSHHNSITVLFLVQNIFQKGKVMRTLSLNTHYFILFRNYRDQLQIETLGRQIFPRQTDYFRRAYLMGTSKRYGYLLVDVSPHSPEVHIEGGTPLPPLRSSILPGEDTVVYTPTK